ncbi:MAG: hypothetical protein JXQ29_06800 [Planctomycetes bacterium]|nr:hypothetical protein [Planctomycetota bacterium]
MSTRDLLAAALAGPGDGSLICQQEPGRPAHTPHRRVLDTPPTDSELGFARKFVAEHGADVRFVGPWAAWLVWDGRRWREDSDGQTWRFAKAVADDLLETARGKMAIATSKEAMQAAGAAVAAAKRFQSRRVLADALALASTELEVVAGVEAWDADPWALNTPTGTMDLRSGEVRPHRRSDLLTKLAGAGFDPKAEAPRWRQFLERVLPDPDVRDYIQRLLGYAASGAVREHVLPILVGPGSNGKSVLAETLAYVLGDYCAPAPPDLLIARQGERHPAELAFLHGRRLVIASESPEGAPLNESLVKLITGGDSITARKMRENFWSFRPTHKVILLTNNRPRVRGRDHGVWRRLVLLKFDVVIPTDEQDASLAEKLRGEGPGVLGWLVEGAARYWREGLAAPAAVQTATAGYQADEDVLGQFIADRCVLTGDDADELTTKTLHFSYGTWCEQQGVRPLGLRTFTGKLRDAGWRYRRRADFRGFAGVRLAAENDVRNVISHLSACARARVETYTQNDVPNVTEPERPPGCDCAEGLELLPDGRWCCPGCGRATGEEATP